MIAELTLHDAASGDPVSMARVGQSLQLKVVVEVKDDIPHLVLGTMLRDRTGHVVWASNTWHTHQRLDDLRAGQRVVYHLAFCCRLGPGSYSISPALVSTDTHLVDNFEWIDNALVFDVVNEDLDNFIGSCWLDASYTILCGD